MRTCRAAISRSFILCALPILALAAGCAGGPEPDEVASEELKAAPNVQERLDPVGSIESQSTNAFSAGATNGFFANLGTNGRTCNSCHVVEDGWTITPGHARSLASNDPLFTPNDGSDCPPTSATQGPRKALSTELVNYGLIRIEIGIPSTASFSLVSATNPEHCALAPGSSGAGGQLFLFRRPLPSTNLVFDATIMWDGRETLQKVTNAAGFQNEAPWLFDLSDQANSAHDGARAGGVDRRHAGAGRHRRVRDQPLHGAVEPGVRATARRRGGARRRAVPGGHRGAGVRGRRQRSVAAGVQQRRLQRLCGLGARERRLRLAQPAAEIDRAGRSDLQPDDVRHSRRPRDEQRTRQPALQPGRSAGRARTSGAAAPSATTTPTSATTRPACRSTSA